MSDGPHGVRRQLGDADLLGIADSEKATCFPTASALAARADVALVYVGLDELAESEGLDRTHMRLPEGQDRLIEAVVAANPRTVVVLTGVPVWKCPGRPPCPRLSTVTWGAREGLAQCWMS